MGTAARSDGRTGGRDKRRFVADRPGRIDALIAARYPDLSRSRVQRLIAGGHVVCDGAPARKSTSVEPGAHITVEIPEVEHEPAGATPDLPVVYEDDEVIVIDKPAGIAVHGAPGDTSPLVVSWFVAHYPEAARHFEAERPGIVHRLDKETSGVLLMAKTPAAQAALSEAFAARDVEKTYVAICEGEPQQRRAVIDAPIGRDPRDRTRMAVTRAGRAARTRYRIVAHSRDRHLVEVQPESGRTHQIRVHLAAVDLPVVGDAVYGKSADRGRHMLHAWRLDVPHPSGGRLVACVPLPADMRDAIAAMGAQEAAAEWVQPASVVRE